MYLMMDIEISCKGHNIFEVIIMNLALNICLDDI